MELVRQSGIRMTRCSVNMLTYSMAMTAQVCSSGPLLS